MRKAVGGCLRAAEYRFAGAYFRVAVSAAHAGAVRCASVGFPIFLDSPIDRHNSVGAHAAATPIPARRVRVVVRSNGVADG